MNYYGERFISLRNDKILNFANINSEYNKLEYNNLKTLLRDKHPLNLVANEKKFTFTYDREDVLKALYGDIEYFYTRAFIQKKTLFSSISRLNSDWAFVTSYYFSFFSATTLLRLSHLGSLYFDQESANIMNMLFTYFNSGSQINSGNYKFELLNMTLTSIDIQLESTGSTGVHENTWNCTHDLLKNILISKTEKESDEYAILFKIIEINNKLGKTYPSTTRNTVNYQAKYGFEVMKNSITKEFILENDLYVFKKIINFKKSDYNNKLPIDLSYSYGYYLNLLIEKLYQDMITRMSGKKDTIKMRIDYIKKFEKLIT